MFRRVMIGVGLVLAWTGCDEEEPELQDRDVVVEEPEEEGQDHAEDQWQEGEAQICEEAVDVVGIHEAAELDEFAVLDPAAGAVNCPMSGVASVTYVDFHCYDWGVRCDHYCDCDYTFSSPCNPPHADCGAPEHAAHALTIGHNLPGGLSYCYLSGWAYCRKQTGLSAVQTCAAKCKQGAPKRTRDCPDCPAG